MITVYLNKWPVIVLAVKRTANDPVELNFFVIRSEDVLRGPDERKFCKEPVLINF